MYSPWGLCGYQQSPQYALLCPLHIPQCIAQLPILRDDGHHDIECNLDDWASLIPEA